MYLCGCGYHFMPATAIFWKYNFFKKASKIQEILKNSKVSFAFLVAIFMGFPMVYCLFLY